MKKRIHTSFATLMGFASTCGLLICLLSAPEAAAQRGGGPRLTPEKAQAAWKVQAENLADELGLKKKDTEKLLEAYQAARESQQAARAELRRDSDGGGGGRGRFQMFADLNAKESGKLKTALAAFLKDKQVDAAIAVLGSFDRNWDRYVDTLTTLELAGKDLNKALDATQTFSIEYAKVMREARENENFEGMREARTELKEKLDAELAKLLSEDQSSTWKSATSRQRRGGRPPQ